MSDKELFELLLKLLKANIELWKDNQHWKLESILAKELEEVRNSTIGKSTTSITLNADIEDIKKACDHLNVRLNQTLDIDVNDHKTASKLSNYEINTEKIDLVYEEAYRIAKNRNNDLEKICFDNNIDYAKRISFAKVNGQDLVCGELMYIDEQYKDLFSNALGTSHVLWSSNETIKEIKNIESVNRMEAKKALVQTLTTAPNDFFVFYHDAIIDPRTDKVIVCGDPLSISDRIHKDFSYIEKDIVYAKTPEIFLMYEKQIEEYLKQFENEQEQTSLDNEKEIDDEFENEELETELDENDLERELEEDEIEDSELEEDEIEDSEKETIEAESEELDGEENAIENSEEEISNNEEIELENESEEIEMERELEDDEYSEELIEESEIEDEKDSDLEDNEYQEIDSENELERELEDDEYSEESVEEVIEDESEYEKDLGNNEDQDIANDLEQESNSKNELKNDDYETEVLSEESDKSNEIKLDNNFENINNDNQNIDQESDYRTEAEYKKEQTEYVKNEKKESTNDDYSVEDSVKENVSKNHTMTKSDYNDKRIDDQTYNHNQEVATQQRNDNIDKENKNNEAIKNNEKAHSLNTNDHNYSTIKSDTEHSQLAKNNDSYQSKEDSSKHLYTIEHKDSRAVEHMVDAVSSFGSSVIANDAIGKSVKETRNFGKQFDDSLIGKKMLDEGTAAAAKFYEKNSAQDLAELNALLKSKGMQKENRIDNFDEVASILRKGLENSGITVNQFLMTSTKDLLKNDTIRNNLKKAFGTSDTKTLEKLIKQSKKIIGAQEKINKGKRSIPGAGAIMSRKIRQNVRKNDEELSNSYEVTKGTYDNIRRAKSTAKDASDIYANIRIQQTNNATLKYNTKINKLDKKTAKSGNITEKQSLKVQRQKERLNRKKQSTEQKYNRLSARQNEKLRKRTLTKADRRMERLQTKINNPKVTERQKQILQKQIDKMNKKASNKAKKGLLNKISKTKAAKLMGKLGGLLAKMYDPFGLRTKLKMFLGKLLIKIAPVVASALITLVKIFAIEMVFLLIVGCLISFIPSGFLSKEYSWEDTSIGKTYKVLKDAEKTWIDDVQNVSSIDKELCDYDIDWETSVNEWTSSGNNVMDAQFVSEIADKELTNTIKDTVDVNLEDIKEGSFIENGITYKYYNIYAPAFEGISRFVVASDMHIVADKGSSWDTRNNAFGRITGDSGQTALTNIFTYAKNNNYHVFLAGDIIDQATEANVKAYSDALSISQISSSNVHYLASDHDKAHDYKSGKWAGGIVGEDANVASSNNSYAFTGTQKININGVDIISLGVNNITSMPDIGTVGENPTVIITHVPWAINDSIAASIRNNHNNDEYYWTKDGVYRGTTNYTTKANIKTALSNDNVVGIISGHVHQESTTEKNNTKEIVLKAAAFNTAYIVTVYGDGSEKNENDEKEEITRTEKTTKGYIETDPLGLGDGFKGKIEIVDGGGYTSFINVNNSKTLSNIKDILALSATYYGYGIDEVYEIKPTKGQNYDTKFDLGVANLKKGIKEAFVGMKHSVYNFLNNFLNFNIFDTSEVEEDPVLTMSYKSYALSLYEASHDIETEFSKITKLSTAPVGDNSFVSKETIENSAFEKIRLNCSVVGGCSESTEKFYRNDNNDIEANGKTRTPQNEPFTNLVTLENDCANCSTDEEKEHHSCYYIISKTEKPKLDEHGQNVYDDDGNQIMEEHIEWGRDCKGHIGHYCGGHVVIETTGIIHSIQEEDLSDDPEAYRDASLEENYENNSFTEANPQVSINSEAVTNEMDIFDIDLLIEHQYTTEIWSGWNSENINIAITKYKQDWTKNYGLPDFEFEADPTTKGFEQASQTVTSVENIKFDMSDFDGEQAWSADYMRATYGWSESKTYCANVIYAIMKDLGYDNELICGVVGNMYCEGTVGRVEYINTHPYWKDSYTAANGKTYSISKEKMDAVKAISKQFYLKSMKDVDTLLNNIDDGRPGIGVGMIQWSGARRIAMLKVYKAENCDFTAQSLAQCEAKMMIAELRGSHKFVIDIYNANVKNCTSLEDKVRLSTGVITSLYEVCYNHHLNVNQTTYYANTNFIRYTRAIQAYNGLGKGLE